MVTLNSMKDKGKSHGKTLPNPVVVSGASSMISYRNADQGSSPKRPPTLPTFAQGLKRPHGSHTGLTPEGRKPATGQPILDDSVLDELSEEEYQIIMERIKNTLITYIKVKPLEDGEIHDVTQEQAAEAATSIMDQSGATLSWVEQVEATLALVEKYDKAMKEAWATVENKFKTAVDLSPITECDSVTTFFPHKH